MGVALVTSQGGSNVEMDVVWYKNEAVGREMTSESGSVALIDFLYFFSPLCRVYNMVRTKKTLKWHLPLNSVSYVVD